MLERVARHLQIEANKLASDERDAFARSAYNRYYYASFLIAREFLHTHFPTTGELRHKSYPEFLDGTLRKRLTSERARASRNEDAELVALLNKAIAATRSLSAQFTQAYGIRIVADYNPETKVSFSKSTRFSLNNVDISEADSWPRETRVLTETISTALKQT